MNFPFQEAAGIVELTWNVPLIGQIPVVRATDNHFAELREGRVRGADSLWMANRTSSPR